MWGMLWLFQLPILAAFGMRAFGANRRPSVG
jgi:hypothetical protein